ncbi:MAG TPA: D-2-hydroxyacid dehydrogenase [Candidatus Binatia bacterium]|jgi:phosphoglycerate dehydrogenase-like enzyme
MENLRIWIRLELPENELRSLKSEFPGVEFVDGDAGQSKAAEIDAVFTEESLADDLVARMAKFRWLHVTRGGLNAYLTPAVKSRPIQLTGSKGIHGRSFTEFALAAIFTLAKKLPECWDAQRQKKWQRVSTDEVSGKTLGIVGLGTIGSELAQKAKCLGMRVLATKRTVDGKPDYVDELGGPEFLPQMLPQVDFLVLCLASIPSTNDIIGEKELRSMKKSAYLINLTGGKAVDEKLLTRALKEKWIAGAALDAFARQPLPQDSELWNLPNVMITARIAGAAAQKWELLLPIFKDNLKRFLSGAPLRNLVDKELGY